MTAQLTRDGSIVDADGRVLFFSIERFVEDICKGDKCFICGADARHVPFNNEHVLPSWIIRRFNLQQRHITLPNLTQFRYSEYTVPCCENCNSAMGTRIEDPISRILAGGMESVERHLQSEGTMLLFTWMALIFLKTHLKDRLLREHLDRRKGDGKLGDWYEWEALHHIHCLARSFYSGAEWGAGVRGSLAVIQARRDSGADEFDYADLYIPKTMLLRMDDVCLISVLNDAGAALAFIDEHDMKRIEPPVSSIQLRELMARFALINVKLRERPVFKTSIDERDQVRIIADLPGLAPTIEPITNEDIGMMLYGATQPWIDTIRDVQGNLLGSRVRQGKVSFLYDSDGRFIKDSFLPRKPADV